MHPEKVKNIPENLRLRKLRQYLNRLLVFITDTGKWFATKIIFLYKICHAFLVTNWPYFRDRLQQYATLIRLDKPVGIMLLLWPTLWALWIAAEGTPDLKILVVFVLGVIFMRSAGCVINDIADRNLDAYVERTKNRPIVSGKVAVGEALLVFLILASASFLLVLQLDPFTIKLSIVAVILAIIYPFTKRYTYMPQLFLGAAFGWAVPMAFSAQTGELPVVSWVLFMTTVMWALVYDTMYAMVDRVDDIKMGIKSTAILFEDADKVIIGIIQVLVMLGLLLVGSRQEMGSWYLYGLIPASLFFVYQQYLIKDRKREKCFAAFLNNNWFGATVFVAIVVDYHFA